MKAKTIRMKTLKMLISSKELSSQEEVLKALAKEGFTITQATLSRDLKQLKVAKAASMNGKYVYVLPNETMYKRVSSPQRATDMANSNGFLSLTFSGQLAVMKTRPGYASAVAYDIDQKEIQVSWDLLRVTIRFSSPLRRASTARRSSRDSHRSSRHWPRLRSDTGIRRRTGGVISLAHHSG